MTNEGNLESGKKVQLAELAQYSKGSVVSRTLAKGKGGTLTLFAFDGGEGLSEHAATFDAWVLALEGSAEVTIDGNSTKITAGELVLMPADIPHAIATTERFKMLLVMFKGRDSLA